MKTRKALVEIRIRFPFETTRENAEALNFYFNGESSCIDNVIDALWEHVDASEKMDKCQCFNTEGYFIEWLDEKTN